MADKPEKKDPRFIDGEIKRIPRKPALEMVERPVEV